VQESRQGRKGLAERKAAILAEWLDQTLASYPQPAGRFLAEEKDRFRNPVGHTLREGLGCLLEELLGGMDPARLHEALERVVRVRAVQDFTPGEALAFLPALKGILRRPPGGPPPEADALAELEARIDRVLLLAFDAYVRCREQIAEIKLAEIRRRYYLSERAGWAGR
jgi:hypothetical protein